MRGRMARNAFALGSAGVVVLGIAGCNQSKPSEGESSPADLKIVEQVQIDENGGEVKTAEGAAPADPAGDGKATCPPVSIAMAGALNGPDAALGINIKNGVQMAIDKHNAANPGCQVQLKPFDTEGDPQKATAIAPQIVDDQYTIGLVGPAFSGETKATGTVFDQAGLVATTASATNLTLSENGWKTFFRGLANDARAGSVGRQLHEEHARLQEGLRRRRQHRLRPRPGHRGARHAGPGRRFGVQHFGEEGRQGLLRRGDPGQGRSPDAVFYGGYYSEAAPFVQQLKDGGLTARSSAPTAPRIRSSSSRPAKRPRARSCPARAARPPARSPTSTRRSSTPMPAPTAPRAMTWAPSW